MGHRSGLSNMEERRRWKRFNPRTPVRPNHRPVSVLTELSPISLYLMEFRK